MQGQIDRSTRGLAGVRRQAGKTRMAANAVCCEVLKDNEDMMPCTVPGCMSLVPAGMRCVSSRVRTVGG